MDREHNNPESPMDMSIELQQMKSAWQSLDRRLEQSHRLQMELLRERKTSAARRTLLPLVLGQVALMAFGFGMIVLGVSAWNGERRDALVIGAGLVLHVYGVLTMAGAGVTLSKVLGVDLTAPVLEIQRRLIALERWYLYFGFAVGLPWFVLWIAVWICLPGSGVENPTWLVLNLALGGGAVALVLAMRAWSRRPGRERFGRWLDESAGSRALARVRDQLGELERFERE
ncbi:MAG: hypothetical protein GC161_17240 [Planctomycetaceae bacterium]|nr:hypothetical protein [Planctomycetaceae bacterium]